LRDGGYAGGDEGVSGKAAGKVFGKIKAK